MVDTAELQDRIERDAAIKTLLEAKSRLTEERGWYAMFDLWRAYLTKQCMFGGCRLDMPKQDEFIDWLKHDRKTREASQNETAAAP